MQSKEYYLFFYSQQQIDINKEWNYMYGDSNMSSPHVNGMPYSEMISISSHEGEWIHKTRFPDSRLIFVGENKDIYWPK